jgi:tetratricopeptide (TPR) repeat protein
MTLFMGCNRHDYVGQVPDRRPPTRARGSQWVPTLPLVAVVWLAWTVTAWGGQEGTEAEWGSLWPQFVEFYDQGKYAEADGVAKHALGLAGVYASRLGQAEAASDEKPIDVVASDLETMASIYQDARRFAEAEPLLARSQEIYEKRFGPDHFYAASILNRLAKVYVGQGKDVEAEPLYKRLLSIYERQPIPRYSEVATALDDLAALYRVQKKLADAEALYRRALAIKDYAHGFNDPGTGHTLNDLGVVLYERGSYQEAEGILLRAVVCFEGTGSPKNPSLRSAFANLAAVHEKLGDTDKQRSYQIRADRMLAP